jgi:hypothetical protein
MADQMLALHPWENKQYCKKRPAFIKKDVSAGILLLHLDARK